MTELPPPTPVRSLTLRRQRLFPALYVGAILLLLFGCQLVDQVLQGDTAASGGRLERSQTLYLLAGQPRTLDPALTYGGPDSPIGHIFSGLITLDTNLQVQPDLAAGWTIGDDGLVYTFFLRKSAVFHDGRPVTAADVVFSWERAVDPATGSDTALTYLGDIAGVAQMNQGEAGRISGLRVIDDHTLEVTLTSPVVYFLAKLAYPVAFVVERDNVSRSNWDHDPNGTGPFTLQEWRDDEIMVLARNDAYYLQPAAISHVVYDLGPGLPLSLYETGEIDLVGLGGGGLARAQDPNDPLAADLRVGVSMCTSVIGLNTRIPPFDDVRVRQAFNYALDKALFVEAFSHGSALAATGALPPGMPGFNGQEPAYPFDPDRARQLLADAGYPDGRGLPPLTYVTSGYGDPSAYVTAAITLWQQTLGVQIEPELLDPFVFFDQLYEGNVGSFFSSGWCADYPDPQNFLDILYHSGSPQNLGGFSDPSVDASLERARVEKDVAVRLSLYAELDRQIVAEAPAIFISHGLSAVLVKPRVQGYVLTPIGVPQWHRISLNQ